MQDIAPRTLQLYGNSSSRCVLEIGSRRRTRSAPSTCWAVQSGQWSRPHTGMICSLRPWSQHSQATPFAAGRSSQTWISDTVCCDTTSSKVDRWTVPIARLSSSVLWCYGNSVLYVMDVAVASETPCFAVIRRIPGSNRAMSETLSRHHNVNSLSDRPECLLALLNLLCILAPITMALSNCGCGDSEFLDVEDTSSTTHKVVTLSISYDCVGHSFPRSAP